MMQTIRQAFTILRQNPLLSTISILGTAFAITMIMAIVITWQTKYADLEPEVNRSRCLYFSAMHMQGKENKDRNNYSTPSAAFMKECIQPIPEVEAELRECRMLSSRAYGMALAMTFELNKTLKCVCGRHFLISGEGKEFCVPDIVDDFKDGYLFKSVWSGSGKGLRWCRRGLTKSTADWCRRELVNHGALILEPIYKKEGDFAMEFYSNGRGKVLFSGYSHFITDEKGVYRGNMLVSNEEVEQWILRYIPLEAFVCIRGYLQKVIEGIYGRYYSGPMGIDMMICPDQRGYPYAIYPHVEINVRMTMGMVARQLYDNFVAPGSKGIFNVDNFPSAEALRTQHEQDMRDYPLVVEEGRIVSGYLALVPVTPQSRYRAYVRVEVC